ncbi:MAG: hypothetical protein JO237_01050, partial [Pseudolabrys sp.]|nr:hypothetical protein [Pseudolabrys sp.]
MNMSLLKKVCLAGGLGGAAALIQATTVSAAIVCTGTVCWHTKERYEYPAESKVIVHEDTWKPEAKVEFREHEGRGYWRDKAWV